MKIFYESEYSRDRGFRIFFKFGTQFFKFRIMILFLVRTHFYFDENNDNKKISFCIRILLAIKIFII